MQEVAGQGLSLAGCGPGGPQPSPWGAACVWWTQWLSPKLNLAEGAGYGRRFGVILQKLGGGVAERPQ